MKTLKFVLIFSIIGSTLLFSSCKKDDDSEGEQGNDDLALMGTYNFSTISDNNAAYGYIRENGEAVSIPESDIDLSIFDECSEVQRIDNIEILSASMLNYTAYDIWTFGSDPVGTRTEESAYVINEEGLLEFTFSDEFGNEETVRLVIEGEKIIMKMRAYVEVWNGSVQAIEAYDENPNFGNSPENAANRLSQDEGDEIYVLFYDQIYE